MGCCQRRNIGCKPVLLPQTTTEEVLPPTTTLVPFTTLPTTTALPTTKAETVCERYLRRVGCNWTAKWSCPGQKLGIHGMAAKKEGDKGYGCCCEQGLWQKSIAGTPPPAATPNAVVE